MAQFVMNESDIDSDVHVVRLAGDVDFGVAPQLKRLVSTRIDTGVKRLVVDLNDTGFIDSTAIGVLVGARKRLSDAGGSLVVVCDNDEVRSIFETVGLENVIALHRSEADALADLAHTA